MAEMNKIQSFKTFSQIKEEEKNQQLQEETKSKREQLVTKIAETLVEMNITSFDELSEEEKKTLVAKLFNEESKVKDTKTPSKDIEEGNDFIHAAAKAKADGKDEFEFNGKTYKVTLKADTGLKESYQLLITEATRWQFGKIDKKGNIISTYVHYDGYPDAVIPSLDNYDSKGVDKVLKDAEMGGMSTLSENPKQNKYYNDSKTSTLDSGDVKNIRKYLKHVGNETGAEYVYLYDERDDQWYGADVFTDKELKPVQQLEESVVTEANGFKNTKDFEAFLEEIDSMSEAQIRKIMGKDYIDTPGFYEDEKDDYEDVIDFMMSNMGREDFDELKDWWESNVQESVVTEGKEMYKISIDTEVEDSKIGNKFYNVRKGEKVELVDDDGDIATVKLKSGEVVNIESKYVVESLVNEAKVTQKDIIDLVRIENSGDYKKAYKKAFDLLVPLVESVVTEAEIKSDDEFKEYAFTVLQKAFGDDFDESKAEEVVDGLISKYSGDYGAMVGALQSSLD